jgi:hypothetical protein
MNERIADLMEQAFDHCKKYDDEGKTGLVRTTEAFHAFAEMIVKDCVKVIEETPLGYGDYRDQILKSMRDHCVDRVRYHFGVE